MEFHYVPLLQHQRTLQDQPRNLSRFQNYLRLVLNERRDDADLVPLVAANPMAREHVTERLDALLALDADGVARAALDEARVLLGGTPGAYKAGLVVLDDLGGGWTNRWACELTLRLRVDPSSHRHWVTGGLWSSETPSTESVRQAILTAALRTGRRLERPSIRTLAEALREEGQVLAQSGAQGPHLPSEDRDYTRAVLQPFQDATDDATLIAALFGDEAARSLGHQPLGLSPWAGLALALHDTRQMDPPLHGFGTVRAEPGTNDDPGR